MTINEFDRKLEAWNLQSKSLDADSYIVTVVDRNADKGGFKITIEERENLTAEEVKNNIERLRGYNARGNEIYIKPTSSKYSYILIDDVKIDSLITIKKECSPCLILKTSPNNFQVVIRVLKPITFESETALKNTISKLNKKHGDPKLAGIDHTFRLAGFSNKKKARYNSFIKIVYSENTSCLKTINWLETKSKELIAKDTSKRLLFDAYLTLSDEEATTLFKEEYKRIESYYKAKDWNWQDKSTLEYQTCKSLITLGIDKASLKSAFKLAINDLNERKRNIDDYIERTYIKALSDIIK